MWTSIQLHYYKKEDVDESFELIESISSHKVLNAYKYKSYKHFDKVTSH